MQTDVSHFISLEYDYEIISINVCLPESGI